MGLYPLPFWQCDRLTALPDTITGEIAMLQHLDDSLTGGSSDSFRLTIRQVTGQRRKQIRHWSLPISEHAILDWILSVEVFIVLPMWTKVAVIGVPSKCGRS